MRKMLTELYFYIMPVFNVDGYHFSWTNVSSVSHLTPKIVQTGKIEGLFHDSEVASCIIWSITLWHAKWTETTPVSI